MEYLKSFLLFFLDLLLVLAVFAFYSLITLSGLAGIALNLFSAFEYGDGLYDLSLAEAFYFTIAAFFLTKYWKSARSANFTVVKTVYHAVFFYGAYCALMLTCVVGFMYFRDMTVKDLAFFDTSNMKILFMLIEVYALHRLSASPKNRKLKEKKQEKPQEKPVEEEVSNV